MNVLLVSECDKRALKESRRILDQFAERRGERTWQTPITKLGLDTLRRLLKASARRNTAVSCHWIRGQDHTELLWIVGDATRFSSHGAVPTDTTTRNVLRASDENDWNTGEEIRLLAALAALFHDFGKASSGFQRKLATRAAIADAFRHEWVSLRLFEAFVGASTDQEWVEKLSTLSEREAPDSAWLERLICDGQSAKSPSPFKSLPPLASAVGWLIVSHHRLPAQPFGASLPHSKDLKRLPKAVLAAWNASRAEATKAEIAACWTFNKGLPFDSSSWRRRAAKIAASMLKRSSLFSIDWLAEPYVAHISRLVLMLADHHYSSLPSDLTLGDKECVLYANTDRISDSLKQRLDEHLIGVENHSSRIARTLPRLEELLPRIARHAGFRRRAQEERFRWQNRAYELALSQRERAAQCGFFGVNMASTGCGKTLANGRILYGLSHPEKGARFSIALGLRTLTLQTGQAYRERLGLGDDDLAVMVGGAAVKQLFKMSAETQSPFAAAGSESAEGLLDENSYVHFEGSLDDGPLKQWLDHNPDAQRLVSAPVLVCTIDHLMPACEGIRGGRQIPPMLRLLTSDLVLDEPDDFDLPDLPALARLVHWAGLLGSRVLLSSATLPPSLIEGLFAAYLAGRRNFQRNRANPAEALAVCTAWFDEYGCVAGQHSTQEEFATAHSEFVEERIAKLRHSEVRRRAQIISVAAAEPPKDLALVVATELRTALHSLHRNHHSVDPVTKKRVSFGLIRMANIDPLIDVTVALLGSPAEDNTRLHVCCYHSRHPLLVRSGIESRLDRLLNRADPESIFHRDQELRGILSASSEENQIFVVMASPVAEVGRDHDYDWGIVEPSSMRSIIQLAGRIRRHRAGACTQPNLYLWDRNVKAMKETTSAFAHPGFENKDFPLESHSLRDLLTEEQLRMIDSRPRIRERLQATPRTNLVDLEHERLRALMIGDPTQRERPIHQWWTTRATLSGELQRVTPFRKDTDPSDTFAFLVNENDEPRLHRLEEDGAVTEVHSSLLKRLSFNLAERMNLWAARPYEELVAELAAKCGMDEIRCAKRFGILELPRRQNETKGWLYHESLGFRRCQ